MAFDATDAAHSVRITCNSGADFILVDWIEAAYARDFTAAGGLLEFSHEPGYNFTVSGFGSDNLIAYDITDSAAVGRVATAAPAGNALAFEPPADPGQAHTYLVLDTAADQDRGRRADRRRHRLEPVRHRQRGRLHPDHPRGVSAGTAAGMNTRG